MRQEHSISMEIQSFSRKQCQELMLSVEVTYSSIDVSITSVDKKTLACIQELFVYTVQFFSQYNIVTENSMNKNFNSTGL